MRVAMPEDDHHHLVDVVDVEQQEELKLFSTEEEMKEWYWKQHKEDILASMMKNGGTGLFSCSNSSSSQKLPPQTGGGHNEELDSARRSLKLLDFIAKVQRQFLLQEEPGVVFGGLLGCLLELTESEYGFIGEIKVENGNKYLQTHAITNIAWNETMQQYFAENVHTGLKFYNLDSLFGHVIVHAETVISNNPSLDKRATETGVPRGHPPLNHFLGIPFFEESGSMMNGMVGIANKPGGYSQEDVHFLEPFVMTCANLIQAYAALRENEHLIDTLEEKVAERTMELELANRRLEEANHRVTEASAAQLKHFACMSHEIRTPLHCIIGVSSLMQETELTQEQEDSVRMIVSSGELLLTVVNDVLDYSKLASGNVDIHICQTRLQETLDAVVHSMEMKAMDRQVTIETFYDARIPNMVETDNRRLQQILYNLLGNALKFSHDNGVIELSVQLVDVVPQEMDESSSSSSLSCTLDDESAAKTRRVLRFVVKDYGKGIDKSDFGKIFQPFLQAEDTTEQFYGGTGLGLPITAKLVAGLNGIICVESKVGEWSTFTVDFPFNGPEADIPNIGARLSNARIFHVCNEERHDQLFSTIKGATNIADLYQLNVTNLKSCQELAVLASINGAIDPGRVYVCLVHEDLFDAQAYRSFAKAAPNVILLTCGPTYSVKDAHGHYRSLSKFLPSVLVESMASHVEKADASRKKPMVRRNTAPNISLTTLPRSDDQAKHTPKRTASSSSPPKSSKGEVTEAATMAAAPSGSSITPTVPVVVVSSLATGTEKSFSGQKVLPANQPKTFEDIRVLVAEDNKINQKVMVRMLERLGLKDTCIDIVDNGQKAVDQTAAQWYDIVLMDQQMPVMDGLTASSIILKRERFPKIAIVSAHAGDYWEQLAFKVGVDEFIPKPCKLEQIRSFLQSYCQASGISMTAEPTAATASNALVVGALTRSALAQQEKQNQSPAQQHRHQQEKEKEQEDIEVEI